MEELELITFDSLEVRLIRKNIKNINLWVRDGEVFVSAPKNAPLSAIKDIIRKRYSSLIRSRELSSSPLKYVLPSLEDGADHIYILGERYSLKFISSNEPRALMLENSLEIYAKTKKQADALLKRTIENEFRKFVMPICLEAEEITNISSLGIKDVKISFKNYKARWGCCNIKNKEIIFSLSLFSAPAKCIEMVVLHEYAHFIFHSHDKYFKGYMDKICPQNKPLGKILSSREEIL